MPFKYKLLFLSCFVFHQACSNATETSENQVSLPPPLVEEQDTKKEDMSTVLFGEGTELELKASSENVVTIEDVHAIINSTVTEPNSSGRTNGAQIFVPEDFELSARGKTIRINVTAKAGTINPSSAFLVAYSTAMNGNSGWKEFAVGQDYQTFSFDYSVPEASKPANSDYIGLISDVSASGRSISLKKVSVEVLN